MTIHKLLVNSLAVLSLLGIESHAVAHEHGDPLNQEQLLAGFGWDFESAEIVTEKVADGLYVLFGLGGNIAVSVGDDGVLVVDDQFPQMMDKITGAITSVGGEGVDFVVNTHGHFDHAEGNLALGPAGATIVSHDNARALMANGAVVNMVMAMYQQPPYPKGALPVMTYDGSMQIHFNDESIALRHFSNAHTDGDTAVFFPRHNAVHLGDVFNNTGYPFIDVDGGGDIDGMIAFCEAVLAIVDEKTVVIPGHGPLTNAATLLRYTDMLKVVRNRVADMVESGMSLEAIEAATPAADFEDEFGPVSASLGFINRVYASLKSD